MRSEVEQFSALEGFNVGIDDLKIDVFGEVAVVTGVFRGTFRTREDAGSFASRSTLVFVNSEGDWLIAHEHHSTLAAPSP